MNRAILLISLLTACLTSYGQEQVRKIQTTRKIETDTTLYHVREYPTREGILSLLKPSEIIMKRKLDAEVSQRIMDLHIQLIDSSHVVLKYFKYKASLQLGNRNFSHNEFPKGFSPAWIIGMHYIETPNHEKDVLEVQLYPASSGPRERLIHKLHSSKIQYYSVDDKIVTQDQVQSFQLTPGSFEVSVLYGKEAAEKYGDPKYAQGVQEIIRIKKP